MYDSNKRRYDLQEELAQWIGVFMNKSQYCREKANDTVRAMNWHEWEKHLF